MMAETMISSYTSTQPPTANPNHTNFTRISCEWLDEVQYYQNNFYWRHKGATKIIILYSLVCTLGGLANLLVIASFMLTPHLRNLRNYFIVNLAISDLLLCVVTAPFTLYLTLNLFWPFGNLTCQFVASAQAVNLFVSCLTLVLIAMDRFLLTLCPVKWRLAARAPFVFYIFVWLVAVLVALPYFFAVSAEEVDNLEPWNSRKIDELMEICEMSRPKICLERTWHRLPVSRKTYVVMVLVIQYFLPLTALGFAYQQIGSTIRKRVKYNTTVDHHRKQVMTQRNRKALLLLLLLVLVYALAWLPMNLYNVLNVFEIIEFSQYYYIFCHLIGMGSTIANPILYAMINDSFRSAFFNLLRPVLKPCTKYITVSPNQHNTHTTYSFTLNQLGSPRRDFKINPDSSVPLINTPTVLPPQLTNGQEQTSALLKVPYN